MIAESTSIQPPDSADTAALLTARGLHKNFGQTAALRGVDCDIVAGEVLAIMGPSGSGKSTLLHCLAGILQPEEGSVGYEGRDITRMGEAERSRLRLTDFGFVFQFGQLVPDLTAAENVALPLLLRGDSRKSAMAAAHDWLDRLDMTGTERKLPGELSGGQAQRVALARAFAMEPRVIFADEPTGSLDSIAGEAVMEILTSAARDHGVTVVLVTHDPRVAAYSDREIVVRDGRISGAGAR